MLKNTYKSLYEKIEPSDKLIKLTKEKMKKEQNKKHFSFYKYGAIAACFILVIIISVPYTNNLEKSSNNYIESSQESLSGTAPENNFASDSINESSNFDKNISFNSSALADVKKPSLPDKIVIFIKGIIDFFINLFSF